MIKILRSLTRAELEEEVNSWMSRGYRPMGGTSTYVVRSDERDTPPKLYFLMTLVKY